jgi:acetate---CoA ligase (ADP-forming)
LDPASVAIIGASNNPDRIGGRPIAYSRRFGFRGSLYPINPARSQVQGLQAYPDLGSLPEVPEVAMIMVPGLLAVEAVEACAAAGVRAAIVAASGFAEVGGEGIDQQQRMAEAARSRGMRLVGPNTQGLANFVNGAMLNFSTAMRAEPPPIAPIAVCSQSGSMAVVPYGLLRQQGLGVRHAHATGNEADVTVAELATEVVREPGLRLMLLYLETVGDAVALAELGVTARLHDVAVLVIKAGRTAPGQAAARSHTGALANEDRVVDAFLRHHGLLRVRDSSELVLAAQLYLKDWTPSGSHTVVLSQSGASCVQAADAASELGLPLSDLTPRTREQLETILPSFAVTTNPVDLTGALINDNGLFSKVLPVLAGDPSVEAAVIALPSIGEGYDLQTLAAGAGALAGSGTPVVAGIVDPTASAAFRSAGVPTFNTEVEAVRALHQFLTCRELMLATGDRTVPMAPSEARSGRALNEAAGLALLSQYGVPVMEHRLCRNEDEAAAAMHELGTPVVLKGCSDRILHKTEVGLVRLGVDDEGGVRSAYRGLVAILEEHDPDAAGVIVAPMVHGRHELIIGGRIDPVFGPTILVGDGGIGVEVQPDVQLVLAPFTSEAVHEAMGSLRVAPLLAGGYRMGPVDLSSFVDAALGVGRALTDPRSGIIEIDLNPVMIGRAGEGSVAIDAVVLVQDNGEDLRGTAGP